MIVVLTRDAYELPRVITPRIAERLGVSRSRVRTELRRGSWRRLSAGAVLTRPDDPTRFDWAEAGVVLGGPTAGLSGWEALRLHGLGGGPPPSAPVLVLTRDGRSRRIGPVLLRRTDRAFSTTLTSIEQPVLPLTPIVGAPRVVADTAVLIDDLDAVRSLVARAVQRGRCAPADLAAELDDCPRRGSAHLRRALDEVTEGARSAAEANALGQLRRSRLPVFELNVPIVDATGREIYVVDVLWRALRAALEIDSREYHFSAPEWQATMRRHNLLTATQMSVVHYPPSSVMRPGGAWLVDVERWLRARAAELGVAYVPVPSGRSVAGGRPAPMVAPGIIRP